MKELRSDCLKARLCILCLGAAIYHLDIINGKILSSEEHIVEKIKWDVRARIMSKGPYKKSKENLQLASLWNLYKVFQ
jgi:hypothetical protein